jgi:FKBP-type peptidyl-prolyl cis-trans isomerase SlyD
MGVSQERGMSDEIISNGMAVYITYSVLDEDGQVRGQQDMPTGYVHGCGSGLFVQVERALEGKRVGDSVEAQVPPEAGFGMRDPSLVIEDDVDNVPPTIRYIGAEAELENDSGHRLTFRVTHIAEGRITLDGNPPMAGRTATVAATVVSVRRATPDEIKAGFPTEPGSPAVH